MAQSPLDIPAKLWPKAPRATISQAASHSTSTSTVMASAWKVFSRHNANVEPKLPQTNTAASVTAKTRPICPKETPPSMAVSMNSGKAAANITSTPSRLASSRPNTSSLLERFDSSNSTMVRRSFSWATALAASMAEKNMANANCNGAKS